MYFIFQPLFGKFRLWGEMCICVCLQAGEGVQPRERGRRHGWDGGREAANERARYEWGEPNTQTDMKPLSFLLFIQQSSTLIRPHIQTQSIQTLSICILAPGHSFKYIAPFTFGQKCNIWDIVSIWWISPFLNVTLQWKYTFDIQWVLNWEL